jgi:hypothetical protein
VGDRELERIQEGGWEVRLAGSGREREEELVKSRYGKPKRSAPERARQEGRPLTSSASSCQSTLFLCL